MNPPLPFLEIANIDVTIPSKRIVIGIHIPSCCWVVFFLLAMVLICYT